MVVVLNATPVVREGWRVGVPQGGTWREIFNSDAAVYGGGNLGNAGAVEAEPIPWQGQPFSLRLLVPPLAAVFFTK